MAINDLYFVLGVLPDAEDIVIKAAYRALAQRYHPDKWTGDPAEAAKRMTEINEAYAVLREPTSRAEYDRTRAKGAPDFESAERTDQSHAFEDALKELEGRWAIAAGIYPDLQRYRADLAKVSSALAFGFVTVLLETKKFPMRAEIASAMERTFLQRFFGTNERIIKFARGLIQSGRRDAALGLNRLVEVLGSQVEPELLIGKIEREFRMSVREDARQRAQRERLAQNVKLFGNYHEARELVHMLGYTTTEDGSLFRQSSIRVRDPSGSIEVYKIGSFVEWVRGTICPSILGPETE